SAISVEILLIYRVFFFFFSSRRRHTRLQGDWSSDVCSPISFCHFGRDVVDLPERLAGLRRTRVGGLIHEDFGAAARVDYTTAVRLSRLEPHRLLVEFSRALEVGNGDVRANRCGAQHQELLVSIDRLAAGAGVDLVSGSPAEASHDPDGHQLASRRPYLSDAHRRA